MLLLTTNCATDNNLYMSKDSSQLDVLTIWDLSIVGSHYSNAYNIKYRQQPNLCMGELFESGLSNSAIAYKEKQISKQSLDTQINFIDYLNTQNMDIEQQLNMGIRYLEIPICYQNEIFYTSNLYLTDPFKKIAKQIKIFLKRNPKEIVLIDLDNNLYSEKGLMTTRELEMLHDLINDVFDNLPIPKSEINKPIQEWLINHKRIIIMTSNRYLARYSDIWDKRQINGLELLHAPTIKKLTALEMLFESMDQNAYYKNDNQTFNIIPIYNEISTNVLNQAYDDNGLDQQLVLNYINTHLKNQKVILVGDKNSLSQISEIISRQKLNTNQINSTAENNDLNSDTNINQFANFDITPELN